MAAMSGEERKDYCVEEGQVQIAKKEITTTGGLINVTNNANPRYRSVDIPDLFSSHSFTN